MTETTFRALALELAAIGRRFHARGWAVGTSGNFSAVVSRRPLRLAITASGLSKRNLTPAGILECDDRGEISTRLKSSRDNRGDDAPRPSRSGRLRPSAETLLHLEIVRRRPAGAVLHTHSVWSTMLSDRHATDGGVALEGYEMLKGLSGVGSHEHREWIPILGNDQDMRRLAHVAGEALDRQPHAHALLLRKHGLYTWGDSLADAERHVEILEFLFEAHCRMEALWHS